MVEALSKDQLVELLTQQGYDEKERVSVLAQIQKWKDRGDHAAIYQNADLGSAQVGQCKIISFGGAFAALVTEEPPTRLPDTDTAINWRYTLHAIY